MTRVKRIKNPFQRWAVDTTKKVGSVVGASVNVQETVIVPRMPDELSALLLERGKKVVVAQITSPIGPKASYEVQIAPDSPPVRFWGERGATFPAGGAANVTEVMRQLGVERQVLLAPLGTRATSRALTTALTKPGVEHAFLTAKGTNFTLCVIEKRTGRTILLCEKNPYETPPQTGAFLSQVETDIVAMVSVRPGDILSEGAPSLVHQVNKSFSKHRVKRAYMPHPDLLSKNETLVEFRKLLKGASLVQVNLGEALLLTGRAKIGSDKLTKEVARQLGSELAIAIMGYGPAIAVVTLGAYGSVAATRTSTTSIALIQQEGFDAKSVVDLSGAGDAHFAALLYYLWLYKPVGKSAKVGTSLELALAMASWIASRKVAHEGPTTIPSAARCDKALQAFKKNGR